MLGRVKGPGHLYILRPRRPHCSEANATPPRNPIHIGFDNCLFEQDIFGAKGLVLVVAGVGARTIRAPRIALGFAL